MRYSRLSSRVMTTAVALLLLCVVADALRDGRKNDIDGEKGDRDGGGGKRGHGRGHQAGGKHHRFGMDDCGRNRTCREVSRECKKILFASMVEDYLDGSGDDEVITTVEKMTAMMAMLMEHQQNLTSCANQTGIQLPNSGDNKGKQRLFGGLGNFGYARHHGGGGGRFLSSRNGFRGGKAFLRKRREARHWSQQKSNGRRPDHSGKWHKGNFGVSEEEAKELRKCLLDMKDLLTTNATLDREVFKAQISPAYDAEPDVQFKVEEAVDSCPEPKDYNIHVFIKCINKACIDNLQLDDEDDNGQDSSWGNNKRFLFQRGSRYGNA